MRQPGRNSQVRCASQSTRRSPRSPTRAPHSRAPPSKSSPPSPSPSANARSPRASHTAPPSSWRCPPHSSSSSASRRSAARRLKSCVRGAGSSHRVIRWFSLICGRSATSAGSIGRRLCPIRSRSRRTRSCAPPRPCSRCNPARSRWQSHAGGCGVATLRTVLSLGGVRCAGARCGGGGDVCCRPQRRALRRGMVNDRRWRARRRERNARRAPRLE